MTDGQAVRNDVVDAIAELRYVGPKLGPKREPTETEIMLDCDVYWINLHLERENLERDTERKSYENIMEAVGCYGCEAW